MKTLGTKISELRKEKKINLRFPNYFIYSKITYKILVKVLEEKSGIKIDKQTKIKVHALLKKAVKQFKGLVLVEVHTEDNQNVEIIL